MNRYIYKWVQYITCMYEEGGRYIRISFYYFKCINCEILNKINNK